ncbi:MAG: HAMP domain-containing histidine kinase [Proteobacteria bacterium]|nr:HAMP domain-containing histidine kinase [Pseudomonadota bacterium]
MRKLYAQIYVAFLGVALLCVVVAAAASHALRDDLWVPPHLRLAARLLSEPAGTARSVQGLPAAGAPRSHVRAALQDVSNRLGVELTLWGEQGDLLASSNAVLLERQLDRPEQGPFHRRGRFGMLMRLDDGRWLAAASAHDHGGRRLGRFLTVLGLLLGAVAVGCYPVARRITRRIERLQTAVESWGSGDLGVRVQVTGSDEVEQLSRSFNRASERIESLLRQQKRVLASASHELRSPLARLSLALELLQERDLALEQRERLHTEAAKDIRELDELIGDLLLAARLEDTAQSKHFEQVDLFALLREETARLPTPSEPTLRNSSSFERTGQARDEPSAQAGAGPQLQGDRRMLRRLLRNLLENARRHGGGNGVEAWLEVRERAVRIVVADRGPGVAQELRERIFEPFYRPEGHSEAGDGGVGLGLALVRQIAEHHGGRAYYEPRQAGGSLFVADLPTRAGCMPVQE